MSFLTKVLSIGAMLGITRPDRQVVTFPPLSVEKAQQKSKSSADRARSKNPQYRGQLGNAARHCLTIAKRSWFNHGQRWIVKVGGEWVMFGTKTPRN